MTNLLILFFIELLSALKRPSLAGWMISFSSSGALSVSGDATCNTYVQPATASSHPSSFSRSNLQNSKLFFASTSLAIACLTSASRFSERNEVFTE